MKRRRHRQMRRICLSRGHAWHKTYPFSSDLMMGRWQCYRCRRFGWLTEQQVRSGYRQPKSAWVTQRIFTARVIEEAVTDHVTPHRRRLPPVRTAADLPVTQGADQ